MLQPLAEEDLPEDLRVLLALWRTRTGARRFPPPEALDIDTLDAETRIDGLLPWRDRLHLVELLEDGDLLFRHFARKSREYLGYDMTGRRLSELGANDHAMATTPAYRRCLTLGRPLSDCMPACIIDGRAYPAYARLLLPLGRGPRADMLIVGLAPR